MHFFVHSLFYGILNSWNTEVKRLQNAGKPIFSIYNQMLYYLLCPIIFAIMLGFLVGISNGIRFDANVLDYFASQSLIAILSIGNLTNFFGSSTFDTLFQNL